MTADARGDGRIAGLREDAAGIRIVTIDLDRPRPARPLQPISGTCEGRSFRLPAISAAGERRLEVACLTGTPESIPGELSVGALLTLDPPLGRGLDLASLRSRDLLLVGAGDGVAILRSVLLSAVRGDDRPRGVTAILSAQQRDDLPFFEEFRALHVDGSADLRFALEDAPPDWDGAVGPLPVLFRGYKLDPPATTAVIAGPGALHKFAVLELLMRGVADTAIHIVPERGFGCELDPCAACAGGGRYVCERGPAFLWSEVKTAPAPYF